jgi:hypothetical protein
LAGKKEHLTKFSTWHMQLRKLGIGRYSSDFFFAGT